MKILNISNRVPYPLHDGGAIAHYRQIKHMSAQGVQIFLLALNTKKHHVSEKELEQHFAPFCRFKCIDIDTTPALFPALRSWSLGKSYNIERFRHQQMHEAIDQLLQTEHFDLIQLESLFVAPYIEQLKTYGIPIVLRQHNAEYEIWERKTEEVHNPLKKLLFRKLAKDIKREERRALLKVDAVVAITAKDRTSFQEMGCKAPMHVYPAGIEADGYEEMPIAKRNVLYHLGSMEWEPNRSGLWWFVKNVWPLLTAEIPDIEMRMAGKRMNDYFPKKTYDGIENLGEVELASDVIESSGICIVPIQSGSGLRIKILEAMVAGRAVVSTPIGVQGLDLDAEKHFLLAKSADDFKDQIKRLQDPVFFNKITSSAKEACTKRYDASVQIKQLLDFYLQLLQAHTSQEKL